MFGDTGRVSFTSNADLSVAGEACGVDQSGGWLGPSFGQAHSIGVVDKRADNNSKFSFKFAIEPE